MALTSKAHWRHKRGRKGLRYGKQGAPTSVNGIKLRSKFEAAVVELLVQGKRAFEYERERLPYTVPHVYVPDITLPNGVMIEIKGYLDVIDRRKLLRVKEAHPDLDLRLLFQDCEKQIGRTYRSATYREWAIRHGFAWAQGPEIPLEWFSERDENGKVAGDPSTSPPAPRVWRRGGSRHRMRRRPRAEE